MHTGWTGEREEAVDQQGKSRISPDMTQAKAPNTPDRLPRKSLFSYGGLALPVAFAGLPLYIHAPDYFTTEYGAVSYTHLTLPTILLV